MTTEQAAALERLRHALAESAQVSTRYIISAFGFIIRWFVLADIFFIRDINAVMA
jgi:hypothetical protein